MKNLFLFPVLLIVFINLLFGQTLIAQNFSNVEIKPFPYNINASINSEGHHEMVDLDNDGDLDYILTRNWQPAIYFKNVGNTDYPLFEENTTNVIPDLISEHIAFVDIDGDDDLDIFSIQEYYRVVFYRNIGDKENPSFIQAGYNPFGITHNPDNALYDISFVDIDNDGDMDIFGGLYDIYNTSYRSVIFYENTGSATQPQFTSPIEQPFGLTPLNSSFEVSPTLYDFDSDGDFDLLIAGSLFCNRIYYVENIGTAQVPQFGNYIQNPFDLKINMNRERFYQMSDAIIVDIDNDGDEDIMAILDDKTIALFENKTVIIPNNLPSSENFEVDIFEDETYAFSLDNFIYKDIEVNQSFEGIEINIPTDFKGELYLDDELLANNNFIQVNEIPNLKYIPLSNNPENYKDELTFATFDGIDFSTSFSIGINVKTHNFGERTSINAFPNPALDFVVLQFDSPFMTSNNLTIVGMDGRVVYQEELNYYGIFEKRLDVSNWTTGLYYVKIKNKKGDTWNMKLLVQ